MAKLKVKKWSQNPADYVRVPVDSSTVIKQGDLISYEGGKAVLLDAATEDATFLGLAFTDSADGETDDVVVCIGSCLADVDLVSATYSIGDGLKYSDGGASTDYELAADGGANTIAFAARHYGSSVTRGEVIFDAKGLGKLFAVSA